MQGQPWWEAAKKVAGGRSRKEASEWNQLAGTLSLGLKVSRIMRNNKSLLLSDPVCGLVLWSRSRPTRQLPRCAWLALRFPMLLTPGLEPRARMWGGCTLPSWWKILGGGWRGVWARCSLLHIRPEGNVLLVPPTASESLRCSSVGWVYPVPDGLMSFLKTKVAAASLRCVLRTKMLNINSRFVSLLAHHLQEEIFEELTDVCVLELRKDEKPLNKGPQKFQRAKGRKSQHLDKTQLKNIKEISKTL